MNPDTSTPSKFLSLAAASEDLELSERTLRRAISAGELPAYKVGKSVRIRRTDLDAWMESKRVPHARSGAPVPARRRPRLVEAVTP